jgi:MEMO1 family protein
MLVFSAIVPHPPLLIPTIGKDNLDKLAKTIKAFDILEEDLEKANPDTIIIISPHGEVNFDAFTINTNETYTANFNNFGEFSTKLEFKSDLNFIMELKRKYESSMPIQLISQDNLDHGASVPLYYLTRKNKNRRIVPINYSFLSYDKHVEFGRLIKDAIFSLDRKYAIIASGDLSHKLNKNAPAGFSPQAKEFDKKLIQLLKKKNVENILNIDSKLVEDSAECGLKSILILLGVMANIDYEFEVLSYESPFGVGYLVGEMNLE